MKRSALFASLIVLGLANLAFVINYFKYLRGIFDYMPAAGVMTTFAMLLSLGAIIYAVVGIIKLAKGTNNNPSPMVFGAYGMFAAAYIAGRYVIALIGQHIFISLSLVATILFIIAVFIMIILVCKNGRKYRGYKRYNELANSRLSFLVSIPILVLAFINIISVLFFKDIYYFDRIFTVIGFVLMAVASILAIAGYSGYVKEHGVLPNNQDEAFINPKPKRQVTADDPKEVAVKNAMEQYGMTREEAEIATGYNKSDDNPISQLGLPPGLGLNVQQAQQGLAQSQPQPQSATVVEQPKPQVDNSAEIAELKRQLLQGKITRAEFDEKLAELKNQ